MGHLVDARASVVIDGEHWTEVLPRVQVYLKVEAW